MKYLLFLLLSVNLCFSQPIDQIDKLYGFSRYPFDKELDLFGGMYSTNLMSDIYGIRDNKVQVDVLIKYFPYVNDDSLFGTSVRDTLLLLVDFRKNDEYIKLLSDYLKTNPNEELSFILNRRINFRNYISSTFNFSTAPFRVHLPFNISMILPHTNWRLLDQKEDTASLLAGEDTYAGVIVIKQYQNISNMDDFIKTNQFALFRPSLFITNPKDIRNPTRDERITLDPVPFRKISDHEIFGDLITGIFSVDALYEQIQVSPDKYDFQLYISRTRLYIIGKNCVAIQIFSNIAGKHVLADRIRLIKKYGFILDSILF